MGMYMYLSEGDADKMRSVEDIDVNEVFQEALTIFQNILIYEYQIFERRLLKKEKKVVLYSIRWLVHASEARIVNFPPFENSQCGINEYVPKQVVMSYLYGIITGAKFSEKENNLEHSNK